MPRLMKSALPEPIGAVSRSDEKRFIAYDLQAGKVLRAPDTSITPRNIVFARDGKMA